MAAIELQPEKGQPSRRERPTTVTGSLLRIAGLIIFDAFALFFIYLLLSDGYWPLAGIIGFITLVTVSYTHLDVYKRQDLHTEAAYRFGRGVPPSLALLGAKRAAELLRTLAGGTVAHGIIDTYPHPTAPVVIDLDPAYVRKLSGLDLSAGDIAALLRRLEFVVEPAGERLHVTAPDHRLDIEGPHDLVEEVCRLYRYDRIPSCLLYTSRCV